MKLMLRKKEKMPNLLITEEKLKNSLTDFTEMSKTRKKIKSSLVTNLKFLLILISDGLKSTSIEWNNTIN